MREIHALEVMTESGYLDFVGFLRLGRGGIDIARGIMKSV
jgi:hypothetical protein